MPAPALPGLLDGVTDGIGDSAEWGYAPLSAPIANAGVSLYTIPSTGDGINHCKNPRGGGSTVWTYGTNGERSTEQSTQGLRFFGPDGYELIGGQSKHELGPVLVTRTGASDTITVELKDRLGSTVNTITGASATLRTYDPFGAARNGNMVARHNGTLNLVDTIHGFTGHTHADDVGLIFMRGRVFDPNVGRFLSVDPVVDSDVGSQGLNPYSYIRNNPLSGTDPTGYQSCTGSHIDRGSGSNCSDQGVATTTVNSSSTQTASALGEKVAGIGASHWNGAVASGGIRGAGRQTALNVVSTEAGRAADNTVATGSGNAANNDASLSRTGMDGWRVTPQGATRVEYAVVYQQWVYPDWLEQFGAWADRAASARADSDLWKLTDTAIVEPLVGAVGGQVVGAAIQGGALVLRALNAGKRLPDAALVVRGGGVSNQTADRINAAIGPSRTPGIIGFSAQCNGGSCLSELGQYLRNKELGVTTVGEIRRVGGDVVSTPGLGHHVTVTGASGEAVSPLLRTVPNPNPLGGP